VAILAGKCPVPGKKRNARELSWIPGPLGAVTALRGLDRVVFAAYGLAYPLPEDEIIRHLLELNSERAAGRVQVLRTCPSSHGIYFDPPAFSDGNVKEG
jgi:hypothetical protein